LVGAEGREAFEARLGSALPLSEYLLKQLSSQVDLNTVDGRAQFAALARPLLERIPAGVFRELLSEEIASKVRQDGKRLANALNGQRPMSTAQPAVNPSKPLRSNLAQALSAGRGTVVRQAVRILVHHPFVATQVNCPQGLQDVKRPGIALLMELLNELRTNPCSSTGALLERWRDRPDLGHLGKLAQEDSLIEPGQTVTELTDALNKLVRQSLEARFEELRSKSELTGSEKVELQRLLPIVNRITH